MGRSEPCELVRRGLPRANQRPVLSLCDNKHSSSHYWTSGKTCTNWRKTYKLNYLTSKATTPKPAIALRTPCRNGEVLLTWRGMMGSPLLLCSAKPACLYSDGGTTCWQSPALYSSLPWCACMCVYVSGVVLHNATKAWCSNSICGIEPISDVGWRWNSDLVLFTTVYLRGDCFQLAGIALFYCAH